MTDSPRDTHFANFARGLYEDLAHNVLHSPHTSLGSLELFKQEQLEIIARHGYDLACHILHETGYGFDLFNIPERVNEIPDMTAWPEEKK